MTRSSVIPLDELCRCLGLCVVIYGSSASISFSAAVGVTTRARVEAPPKSGHFILTHEQRSLQMRHTAVIVCDIWDEHWCKAAATRLAEMGPRVNEFLAKARSQGALVIHAPSGCITPGDSFGPVNKPYAAHPARLPAKGAPRASQPLPQNDEAQVSLNQWEKAAFPFARQSTGCGCSPKCRRNDRAWNRQSAAVEIQDGDVISDNGEEILNLLKHRTISNVLLAGAHLNEGLLTRSYGLRRLVRTELDVLLVRDLADCFYDSSQAPFETNHFAANDLMVAHIEKFICPTITSELFTGRPPFRFKADPRPPEVAGARGETGPPASGPAKAKSFRRDPADQPFRSAPMAESTRSIVLAASTNLHVAFDTELLRVHTAWAGPSLNLVGPSYSGSKMPALCYPDGEILWTAPPFFPWAVGSFPVRDSYTPLERARFHGVSTSGGRTTLVYDLPDGNQGAVRIHDSFSSDPSSRAPVLTRHFVIGPCEQTLWFLAHAELGRFSTGSLPDRTLILQREHDALSIEQNGFLAAEWRSVEGDVDYKIPIVVEVGGSSLYRDREVQGHQARAWLRIPPHTQPVSLTIRTARFTDRAGAPRLAALLPADQGAQAPATSPVGERATPGRAEHPSSLVVSGDPKSLRSPGGNRFYRIERFPVPKQIELLVGGMDFLPNGDLVVSTFPGEIYIVEQPQGDPQDAVYRRFARGLNEPLGLKVVDGRIYVLQKSELTLVQDTDNDGEADWYERINAGWGYTGNYHMFVFGPAVNRQGDFYIALPGVHGNWEQPYSGWAMRISADGRTLKGAGSGLRAPNGWTLFGPDEDLFLTDNQGQWIGTCKLNHVKAGRFYGFPASTPASSLDYRFPRRDFSPPAVWLPRTLSPSASDIVVLDDKRFGPFEGQLLVGDWQLGKVNRVALEKVNGEWQGAVWPFAKGFSGAVNRLVMGPDGRVYIGGCRRTWPGVPPLDYSLERLVFTGTTPFEVQDVRVHPDGLDLIFTEPADRDLAEDPENLSVTQFGYRYHAKYGSAQFDHEDQANRSTQILVKSATLSTDGLKLRLNLEGWRTGYVTAVRLALIENRAGEALWNDTFYYTLNQIPKQDVATRP